uniref:Uncharacterized protein n=1 Tax=Rhizophagus irregularis (strain DAOM 181602 / DAOM 197198 / MUCL 43194) TaxID=747089 RepID=U9TN84_RHIID
MIWLKLSKIRFPTKLEQKFANIISVTREQFSDIFDRVKGSNDYSLDQMCAVVSVDILRLGMRKIQ